MSMCLFGFVFTGQGCMRCLSMGMSRSNVLLTAQAPAGAKTRDARKEAKREEKKAIAALGRSQG